MNSALYGAITIFCTAACWSPAEAGTAFEQQVLVALNNARTDPQSLAHNLEQYRGYFDGMLLRYPGSAADLETEEGVAAVDEAIAFLVGQAPLSPVEDAPILAAAAAELTADQAQGGTGHDSHDGSSPADRSRRHGGGAYVAEVIAYGSIDPPDVVRQLLVDDGVPDRGHRTILFSPELRFAGVACGPHPEFRIVCVIDLATRADGR